MCIIAFSYKMNASQPLIIAANRDEFYERPSEKLHQWDDMPHIYAGRDLEKLGTWLAVSKNGRFAAVTNYRDMSLPLAGKRSRGDLPVEFLNRTDRAIDYAKEIQENRGLYGACNLLLYDGEQFIHYNTAIDEMNELEQGIYCVSNATLNTPWPKVVRLQQLFTEAIHPAVNEQLLFEALQNVTKANDEELPATGLPYEMEKAVSSIFIDYDEYGTRASTIVKRTAAGWDVIERTFVRGHCVEEVREVGI